MFLPWWVIIIGIFVVAALAHGAQSEHEKCDECAAFHEGDHEADCQHVEDEEEADDEDLMAQSEIDEWLTDREQDPKS